MLNRSLLIRLERTMNLLCHVEGGRGMKGGREGGWEGGRKGRGGRLGGGREEREGGRYGGREGGKEGGRGGEGGMTVIHILKYVCSIAIQWHHSI